VSRSVHTRPRAIRAADRLREPFAPRSASDPRGHHALVRTIKSDGIASTPEIVSRTDERVLPLPRIREQRPPPGTFHPLSRSEIRRALAFFGAECIYGVRSITLASAGTSMADDLVFGRLIVPGRIILYPQSLVPWTVAGRLPAVAETRLQRAGAIIERIAGGTQTTIQWPGATLRDFMLFDVLLHEIGHHIMQHHTGKRTMRIARTKDHEAFADAFARNARARFAATGAIL
jgi:hypothetical protein